MILAFAHTQVFFRNTSHEIRRTSHPCTSYIQFNVCSRDFPLKNTVSCLPSTSKKERTRHIVEVNGDKGPMAHHSPNIADHFGRKSFREASTISWGEDGDGYIDFSQTSANSLDGISTLESSSS